MIQLTLVAKLMHYHKLNQRSRCFHQPWVKKQFARRRTTTEPLFHAPQCKAGAFDPERREPRRAVFDDRSEHPPRQLALRTDRVGGTGALKR